MEWKTVKLGEVCDLIKNREKGVLIDKSNYVSTENMLPNKGGVVPSSISPYDGAIIYHPKDVLISNIRPYFKKIWFADKIGGCSGDVLCFRSNSKIDSTYLYYLLSQDSFFDYVMAGSKGTKMPRGDKGQIMQYEFPLPPLETQRRIVAILSSLDDKIENNNRINRNLEEQAQALFKSWFVDFEPFGGTMPEDWKKGNLLDVADLFDHKRIPLSGMQRDRMEKIYPYYGATSVMDYVDNYLYDGIYLLMGEDGSVMTDEGFPFLQYVEGKFWCNNHAHIMQGKNGYTTEMLYCLLNRTNVSGIVTGAVQGKISQASMKKIPVVLPPAKVCADMSGKLAPYFDEIRSLRQESQRLATLRDTLLPKLMKGEIAL